jgi:alkylation response protein AidB-like acyl-CoA dehydrogenase
MPSYIAPVRETRFVLHEVLGVGEHVEGLTTDLVDAILEQAARFTQKVIAPLNAAGDAEGCHFKADGSVQMPAGFVAARSAVHRNGWGGLSLPAEWGGQELPEVLQLAVTEYFCSASQAFLMLAGTNNGPFRLLHALGSEELRRTYLPRIASGAWASSMCLTESQSGSDLSLISTRASPRADGSYSLSGTKIFITGGEHDLTENIIHFVLARTSDAPSGTKGLSLFLVPKILLNADGSLGPRNAVSCVGIEHKMGLRASPTCTMQFEGARGWLLGEENRGLAGMFILLNAARLEVGIQGLANAQRSYQVAAEYALERRQGRSPSGPVEPDQKADRLIVHPDVRRMLLDAKAFTEAMRCLVLWCGLQLDLAEHGNDPATREAAKDLLEVLTPIIKGYGTEAGFDTTVAMQQILGGHGYIVESGMEQFVRDTRITMVYEGANGIQANDLANRKTRLHGGRGMDRLLAILVAESGQADDDQRLGEIARRLATAVDAFASATRWVRAAEPVEVAGVAMSYLQLAARVTLGLMTLRMARTAVHRLAMGGGDLDWLEAKVATGLHFARSTLVTCSALRERIETGARDIAAFDERQFIVS